METMSRLSAKICRHFWGNDRPARDRGPLRPFFEAVLVDEEGAHLLEDGVVGLGEVARIDGFIMAVGTDHVDVPAGAAEVEAAQQLLDERGGRLALGHREG